VLLDGVDKGNTPVKILRVAPGVHTLEIQLDGYVPYKVQKEIHAADSESYVLTPMPKPVQVTKLAPPPVQVKKTTPPPTPPPKPIPSTNPPTSQAATSAAPPPQSPPPPQQSDDEHKPNPYEEHKKSPYH
jgi:hypothetical protein